MSNWELFPAEAVQSRARAHEQAVAGDSWSGEDLVVQFVDGEYLLVGARLEHRDDPGHADDEHLAGGGHR